jgi:hypothetical protein
MNRAPGLPCTAVPEVQSAVAGDNLDRDRPRRRVRVASHQLARPLADLNADVHVLVTLVGGSPDPARQMMTPDLQQHRHRR